jgi:2-iminobutanoate/2-iminopropanoate deaminase
MPLARMQGTSMKAIAAGVMAIMAGAASAQGMERPAVEYVGQPMLGEQRLPFSSAVRVGDLLILSGQLGNTPDGKLPEGMEAQARQAMENVGAILKGQGLTFGDVAKCTVMLDDMKDWPAFNKVYVTYFPDGKFPARSAFGADGLALGALVEVECWAHVRGK